MKNQRPSVRRRLRGVGHAGHPPGVLISVHPASADFLFHIFECDAGRFGEGPQNHQKLHDRHRREKHERGGARERRHQREGECDDGVHNPVGEAAQTLALGAHQVGENFAEIDPDHGALREGEKADETDQQPHQQVARPGP